LKLEERVPAELGIDLRALAPLARAVGPLAIVDLETTGLPNDPASEILEIGAVLIDPDALSVTTLETLVQPRGPIPLAVRRITGLGPRDVVGAPDIDEVAPRVAAALAGRTLIAHNADFERHFLSRFVSAEFRTRTYLDTQDLLSLTHPDAPDLRLETFTRLLLDREESHRAFGDAHDTACVLSRVGLAAAAGERRYATARNALESFAPDSAWLGVLAKASVGSGEPEERHFVAIPATSEKRVPFDEDAIAAALADAERGARHFGGYRVRDEQIRMAREFFRVLDDGGRLLLEGGTGSGKSLAYLSAAIPFAIERADGGVRDPVVISTRTKLLQDQLLGKDIPAAAAMLGYPELNALSIKGRANYACARRLERTLSEGRQTSLLAEDRMAFASLLTCARTRRHGEVGTLPGALLFRYPALRELRRRAVAPRAEYCTREQCAHERACPLGRRRASLARAHLIVANHDLLLRWPPDYPRFTHVVVDEAHDLAGVADEAFASEVRPAEVLDRVDELFGREPGSGGNAARVEPKGPASVGWTWRRALQQDLVALGESLAPAASEYGELEVPRNAETSLGPAAALASLCADRLEAAVRDSEAHEPEDEERALVAARARTELLEAASALRDAFMGIEDAVASFESLGPPFDRWRLVVRAVEPGSIFAERFADRLEGLACVSASVFVGGDPYAALGTLEVESSSEIPSWRISVDSPFPYAEHMRVVALEPVADLVAETEAVLADLARLLGGRTLGLFTSLKRMRDVRDQLSENLRRDGFDVLSPRRATDDPAALVERFSRAGAGNVLLGARTFWQGLDIPGDALQAVVIEKLPFEVPTELRRRREARLRATGDDAFGRFTTGTMLLNLKQMIGRLIRTETDRGIAVIVDARTDRPYFRRLVEALPPGSVVSVARREDLPAILGEVGLGPAADSKRDRA
jgi:ATP-dependent DNA helicase DinG